MKRRDFLAQSSMAGAVVLAGAGGMEVRAADEGPEFYEFRIYEMPTGSRKSVLHDYLSKAAIPAWNRLGTRPVGVFTVVSGANALLLYVLVPHASLDAFLSAPSRLAADAEYQKAAAPYLSASIDSPAYTRFDTWLLRAFRNLPRLRLPKETAANAPRLFELRIYESHSETAALRKIEMFNDGGEIGIFDRVGLRPVFFGQTLAGHRQPNLVYLTVHADMAAREKTWDAFRADEGWKKLSADPAYANTVSATTVAFLKPTDYSQL